MRALKNAQFCSSSRKAQILTGGIYLIFRGLKFEPDAVIGQKGAFCKALNVGIYDKGNISSDVDEMLTNRY